MLHPLLTAAVATGRRQCLARSRSARKFKLLAAIFLASSWPIKLKYYAMIQLKKQSTQWCCQKRCVCSMSELGHCKESDITRNQIDHWKASSARRKSNLTDYMPNLICVYFLVRMAFLLTFLRSVINSNSQLSDFSNLLLVELVRVKQTICGLWSDEQCSL